MSKLFYDKLLSFEKIEKQINNVAKTSEEKEELWHIVDGLVHHKILEALLDQLPKKHHGEFLKKFSDAPHDESLLSFLKDKTGEVVEEIIRREVDTLTEEILQMFKGEKK